VIVDLQLSLEFSLKEKSRSTFLPTGGIEHSLWVMKRRFDCI
jgi:hypothetical protein